MKQNRILSIFGALIMLSTAAYITSCSNPTSNSNHQGNLEGVWEVKRFRDTTWPVIENGVTEYLYICFDGGKMIQATKKGILLEKKLSEAPYTLSGNTITMIIPGQPVKNTYIISGNSLTMNKINGTLEIKADKVPSPTVQEMKAAPQG